VILYGLPGVSRNLAITEIVGVFISSFDSSIIETVQLPLTISENREMK
jgi:hypothetical protein